ncbi:DUF72 domain-containing protein [Bosea sp. NBC_00550]|uniref:DUF72 domain-containing protein n=1 Tax=Bosea sp. NBC_00550 TaxID=2969621 RepID=UPI002231C9CD|nr:DUF72 domain-containing protein [Bosea sp. NBC_00550]UZF95587.1 DUF72 domain-containing protein [Bosea sp. NBC_00550]
MRSQSGIPLKSRLFIGTAGWAIPKIHAPNFPAEGSHLERYATVFSTAEINSSFYRHHRRSTYERWATSVPDQFRFSVKAPRWVTHSDWLDISSDLEAFFAELDGLGIKLGPVLIQLPPKRTFISSDADRFLSAFRRPRDVDIVLEPRHASWFGAEAEDLLREYRISRVAADPPPAVEADEPGGRKGLTYIRLHGSPEIYRSSYSRDRLKLVANRMIATAGSMAWCIFDNTTSYAAAGDALALKKIIGSEPF